MLSQLESQHGVNLSLVKGEFQGRLKARLSSSAIFGIAMFGFFAHSLSLKFVGTWNYRFEQPLDTTAAEIVVQKDLRLPRLPVWFIDSPIALRFRKTREVGLWPGCK